MNPKLLKVMEEITKTKDKIADFQTKLRELERQKTELENAEIVAIFRKEKMTEEEFAQFIGARGLKGAAAVRTAEKEADHEE
ncbi:DUF4315 family protein [Oscillibacter sp. GMB15532]|uniref:DUF4315 family protein n=1 Tax=Oscillibacter sp. GMB15532 TaxID=3230022 RepID=UPI0034DE0D6C